jgi:hypothetical protein
MKYKTKCKTNPISSPHGHIIIINQSKEIIISQRISLAGALTWLVTQILDIYSKFWMRGFAFCKLVLGWLQASKDPTQESNWPNIDSYGLACHKGGSLVTYKCSLNVICRCLYCLWVEEGQTSTLNFDVGNTDTAQK